MSNPALLNNVLAHSTGKGSRIHGPNHWAGVAAAGLTLLDSTPDADPLVVLLFALFHDSMRLSDGHDPEHGKRGAELARTMRDAGEFELEEARLLKLEAACTYHDKGGVSEDPTIGTCWDADRLNLGRVGIKPNPALLSTSSAKELPEHAARVFSSLAFNWPAIFAGYEADNTVCLRFGEPPLDGCSAVPILGFKECGVSVYPGSRLPNGTYVLDLHRCLLGIDTRFLSWLLRQARPLYLVEGRQVGVGGMGEPVLEGARIVEEVAAASVGVLPNRQQFNALIKAWRMKREGKDPGPLAFMGAKEPDERPLFPFAATEGVGMSGFWSTVESQKRELLRGWGLLEASDRMKAEPGRTLAKSAPPSTSSLLDLAQTPWKETPWK